MNLEDKMLKIQKDLDVQSIIKMLKAKISVEDARKEFENIETTLVGVSRILNNFKDEFESHKWGDQVQADQAHGRHSPHSAELQKQFGLGQGAQLSFLRPRRRQLRGGAALREGQGQRLFREQTAQLAQQTGAVQKAARAVGLRH